MAKKAKGLKAFTLIWVGQGFSMIASAMTHFAMGIWAWDQTGQATSLALVALFSFAPVVIFSPIAGVLVDRWNRRWVMIFSDIGAGLVTLSIFILMVTGKLEVWHLYITGAVGGIFGAFQWPAYSAAISLLVPKKQYAYTRGMISMAESGVGVLAPILAAALLGSISIKGIFLIDLATLVVALAFLLLVTIPEPKRKAGGQSFGGYFKELTYGFRYLIKRPSLLNLQLVFFLGNFFATLAFTLINPMILAATNNQPTVLATVQSVGAIGGLVGGIILTAWGGPRKKIHGVLVGWAIVGVGIALMGLGCSLIYWMSANFLMMAVLPIVNGANQAIWQSKVSRTGQAQVTSTRRLISQMAALFALAVSGPLADQVFEPAMIAQSSWLFRFLGLVIDPAPGAGMSIIITISGILVLCVGLGAYRNRLVLHVEELIPDHDEEN